jgi:transposase InsO family protein
LVVAFVGPGCWGRWAPSELASITLAESFFWTLQMELLDRQKWRTRQDLALAIIEYLEAFSHPVRRHSSIGYLSPVEFEAPNKNVQPAA